MSFRRGHAVVAVLIGVVSLGLFSGAMLLGWGSAIPPVNGDTVVVYGPERFETPTGSSTLGVESFTLAVQPLHRYLIKVANGNADGSNRASAGNVVMNGQSLLAVSDIGSGHTATRVVQALASDTLEVTVQGGAGAFLDVSVLEVVDPTFAVHGPATFVRATGAPETETVTFAIPQGAGAPFYVFVQNGRSDGTKRTSGASLELNGQTVMTETDFNQSVGGFIRQITLQSQNTADVMVKSVPSSEVTMTFVATDVGAPVLAVTAPADKHITSQASIDVTGIVQDHTPTTVTVNGVVATRNGESFTATVNLTEGSNTIAIHAVDAAGNTSDATRTVTRDSQAPVVNLTAPTDGLKTSQATVAVTGTVTDATTVTVNLNGTPLPVGQSGEFSGEVTLVEGTNFVSVTATDQAGNATTVARQVTLDTGVPVVTLTAPADGAFLSAETVTVTGSATDATALSVTVDGVAVQLDGTGNFSQTVDIVEGANTITVVATDAAANATTVTRSITRDTHAPAVVLDAPADNFATRFDTITVRGSVADATPVMLTANGIPAPVDGAGAFVAIVPVEEGANTITVVATDAAGNTSTLLRNGTSDRTVPVISITSPANGATTSQASVAVSGTVTDAGAVTVTVNGAAAPVTSGTFTATVPLNIGTNAIAVVATDAVGNASTATVTVNRNAMDALLEDNLPIDSSLAASAITPGVATNVSSSTRFLYEGPNAVQTGVVAGAIDPLHVAVVRGKVTDRSGNPIAGVTVSVTDQPNLGSTTSRANGMFDMAVNGYGPVAINYSKAGYLPVHRQFTVSPLDYTPAPDVVMTQLDTIVTTIAFAQPMEAAQASPQSDADGARRQTLLFQQGTTVTMVMPDGTTQPLMGPINVRATEYTVGPNGPKAMPAELPPTSGYTYAVELSIDEAMAAGASTVQFSKPVYAYNENFLDLPVGFNMPSAYYDAAKRSWIAAPDGRIVKIHAIVNDTAVLDINGVGPASADTLMALGVTDAELKKLAELYVVGQTLWRMPISHFSPWDFNAPSDCINLGLCEYPEFEARHFVNPSEQPPCPLTERGSIIACQAQVLSEQIGVVGTPYTLYYHSDRQTGHRASYILDVPVTQDSMTTTPDTVLVEISVAGRKFTRRFTGVPGQRYRFEWDGFDAYGRRVNGRQRVDIRVGYGYAMSIPNLSTTPFRNSFGQWITRPTVRRSRVIRYFWTTAIEYLGSWDSRSLGLGGWTLGDLHSFDVVSKRVLRGDGSIQGGEIGHDIIRTVAGQIGENSCTGNGGPATNAAIGNSRYFEFGHDGGIYIVACSRIRRIGPDGIVRAFAGTSGGNSNGNGGHARLANMNPSKVQFLADGSVVFFDGNSRFVGTNTFRRIGPDSIIRNWAGGGSLLTDDVSADSLSLAGLSDYVSAPDGSLYFTQGNRIRQITPAMRVYTVAGTGACVLSAPTEGVARDIPICPKQVENNTFAAHNILAIGPDGSLYYTQTDNSVRRIWPDGRMTPFAFGGNAPEVMGTPALGANVGTVASIRVGPDNTLYWMDLESNVRAVGPDGIMRQVAGPGPATPLPDGAIATTDFRAHGDGFDIRIGPDGAVYVGDAFLRIRRIGPAYRGLQEGEQLIASSDASEAYVFSGDGRHLKTVDPTMGVVLLTFSYDTLGRLTQVVDRDSNVTMIERDAGGKPRAIVAPFGQRTALSVGADGMLKSAKPPATSAFAMTYGADGFAGLLATFHDPATGTHTFAYDSLAKLSSDADARGAQALVRSDSGTTYQVQRTDAAGITSTHRVMSLPTGTTRQVTFEPGSKGDTLDFFTNGGSNRNLANGTLLVERKRVDPRFGGASAFVNSLQINILGKPQALIRRGHGVILSPTGDLMSPLRIADTVRFGPDTSMRMFVTTFDAPSRSIAYTSAESRVDTTFLDSLGRLWRQKPSGKVFTEIAYDTRGRLSRLTQTGRSIAYHYNAAGLVDTIIDPLGRRTRFTYDSSSRPTSVVRPDGRVIGIAYDAAGRLTSVTPSGRPSHSFGYDSTGLLTSYTPPQVPGVANTTTTYRYDSAKRLTHILPPDGDSVVLAYDAAGRRESVRFADAVISTTYSASTGLPSRITTTAGGGEILIGTSGSLVDSIRQASTDVSGTARYSYDVHHRVRTINTGTNADNRVTYSYDRDNLITSILRSTADTLIMTRSAARQLAATRLRSVTTTLAYDSVGNLVADTAAYNGVPLLTSVLTRDSLDRIVMRSEVIAGVATRWAFAYDSAGRLSQVTRDGTTSASYEYDANGNRLSRTAPGASESGSYDDQDRLSSYAGVEYRYTPAGALRYRIAGTDTTAYHYDAIGALRRVDLPGNTTVAYIVDAFGRRIGRRVNDSITHRFIYESPLRIAAEVDANGQTVTRFVYGSRLNVPEFMVRGGIAYRLITDHLGSVRLVIRTTDGVVAQRVDYDEFGRVVFNSAPGFQPFGYAGGIYDELTDLVRLGARDYDAHTGRWTTRDPLGFSGGSTNLYSYVDNSPVTSVDPTGLRVQIIGSDRFKADLEWLRNNNSVVREIFEQLERSPKLYVFVERPEMTFSLSIGGMPILKDQLPEEERLRQLSDELNLSEVPSGAALIGCPPNVPGVWSAVHEAVHLIGVDRHGRKTRHDSELYRRLNEEFRKRGYPIQ